MIRGHTAPLRSPAPACSTAPTRSSTSNTSSSISSPISNTTRSTASARRRFGRSTNRSNGSNSMRWISRLPRWSATANRCAFALRDNKLAIAFDPPLVPGQSVAFRIVYRANAAAPRAVLRRSDAGVPRQGAPRLDAEPRRKRALLVSLARLSGTRSKPRRRRSRCAKGIFALANGKLIERRDEGEHTIFTYRQEIPHSTYLMTLVAGPFVEARQADAGARRCPSTTTCFLVETLTASAPSATRRA